MFLYLVLVSVIRFSMHSYEKMKKEENQLRKQKPVEIFICMKNELNSLKKDIEILAITKYLLPLRSKCNKYNKIMI